MKKFSYLYLLIVMLFPAMAMAQESETVTDDLDSLIIEMSELCPVDYGDDWAINSVTIEEDTAYVDVQVPGQLKAFMSSLTGNGANVKRLWLNQIAQFDKRWRTFAERLFKENRTLVFLLSPGSNDKAIPVVIGPTDLTK